MRTKRFTTYAAIIGLLLLLAPTISGARAVTDVNTVPVPEAGENSIIDKIKDQGTLKVGVTILPPWVIQKPKTGEYIGSATVVARAAAKSLGVDLQYVEATWDTIIAGLIANKYVIAAAPLFETPSRAKVINFATFDRSGTCYLVRPQSDIDTLSDINSPSTVYLGYTGYATAPLFHEKYPKAKMQMVSPPPGSSPRVQALLSGRGNLVPFDSPLAYWMAQKWSKLKMIPPVEQCFEHPDLKRPIGVGYPEKAKAFGNFLKKVIKANKEKIAAANKLFSQPKWLKEH